ncbi:HNH endonuclease [Janthinobacterium sp. GW458P]
MEQRVAGGSDTLGNRVLLHPNCHTNVHADDLQVAKPVPVQGLLSCLSRVR